MTMKHNISMPLSNYISSWH